MRKPNYTRVFSESNFNSLLYFQIKTGEIPYKKTYYDIRVEQLYRVLSQMEKFETVLLDTHYTRINCKQKVDHAYMMFGEKVMLYLNQPKTFVTIYFTKDVDDSILIEIQELILGAQKEVYKERSIGLITSDSGSLSVKEFTIEDFQIDLKKYYNDDFIAFDTLLQEKLNERPSKGIVLLHGAPGTGKTSYIKHLIHSVKKRFIYLPSDLSDILASPSFLSFLIKYPNSILIIEDAEQILAQRRPGGRSAVSNLLNLSDGLLGSCLNIQVIATFNAPLEKIDSAILRKGRIIGRYEFMPLEFSKANSLLKSISGLEQQNTFTQPATLAEIFNYAEQDFFPESNSKIGFKVNDN